MKNIFEFLKNHALKTRDFILDIIFPIECFGCGRENSWICPECFKKLTFKKNSCFNCKKGNLFGEFCPECRPNFFLDGIWIAGDYDNRLLAGTIKALKYYFIKDLGGILGNYMSDYLRTVINCPPTAIETGGLLSGKKISGLLSIETGKTLVMPAPLHKKRLKWRGFNQAEIIAQTVANNFGMKINSQDLIRVKNTKPQASLDEADRKKNITGCFSWQGQPLNGQTVILIDDVATTGATLNECAKALKQNGAGEVWGLVAAKG